MGFNIYPGGVLRMHEKSHGLINDKWNVSYIKSSNLFAVADKLVYFLQLILKCGVYIPRQVYLDKNFTMLHQYFQFPSNTAIQSKMTRSRTEGHIKQ